MIRSNTQRTLKHNSRCLKLPDGKELIALSKQMLHGGLRRLMLSAQFTRQHRRQQERKET